MIKGKIDFAPNMCSCARGHHQTVLGTQQRIELKTTAALLVDNVPSRLVKNLPKTKESQEKDFWETNFVKMNLFRIRTPLP